MDITEKLLLFQYPALFVLAILEGPVTSAAAGFLIKLGHFHWLPTYSALLLGDLAGDIGWYALGYHGAHRFIKRFGNFFGLSGTSNQRVIQLFKNHEGKILFLSKITMGFGLAVGVLFTAGMSRISFKKFLVLNFLGGLLWTAFLLFIGYTFGDIYLRISDGLKIVSAVFFGLVILLALKGYSIYVRNRLLATKDSSS
jgi:membrane protein DedA with SNARE-associated domain